MVVLAFSGCVPMPIQDSMPEEIPVEILPIEQLDEGEHHPAVAALLQKAEQARQAKQYSAAASYIDQAREIFPRNPEIYYRQGWLALQQGLVADAESFARRGLVFAAAGSAVEHRLKLLLADSLEQQNRLMEAMIIRARLGEQKPAAGR